MKTKWALIIIGCLAGTLLFGQNQDPNLNPKQQALERFQEQVAKNPINFWGKVVDQNGAPIEGATGTLTLAPRRSMTKRTNLRSLSSPTPEAFFR